VLGGTRDPPAAAAQVPLLANMRPHGKYHMSDLDSIGGVPVVMKARLTMHACVRARARTSRLMGNAQRELSDGGEGWPATALSWVATSCITLQPVGAQELLDGGFLHGEAMTVTGKTVAENLAGVKALSHPDLQALPCCLQAAL